MNPLQIKSDPKVEAVFNDYPDLSKKKMEYLRKLIIETAEEMEGLESLEETLKWGEPSYLTKHGSTIRIDWKAKNPDQYAMYFQCTSQLIPTFRFIYNDLFKFEGNRAIIFQMNEKIPEKELKTCIRTALIYHKVKNLPTLGL
ncbi:MAG: DUF1801 domain-containing protein [Bacteroidota bacterium]